MVQLDEAHFNFHTASGRYQTFADLLRRDGYVVQASGKDFSPGFLIEGKILVIANALSRRNQTNWNPPIDPSFTDIEIHAVRDWVHAGGSLLLIVDHFPMPATVGKLAEAFGVRFHNGYAVDPQQSSGPLLFRRSDKTLAGPTKSPMGMNSPIAKQNAQFLLNVMHWLSGLMDKQEN